MKDKRNNSLLRVIIPRERNEISSQTLFKINTNPNKTIQNST